MMSDFPAIIEVYNSSAPDVIYTHSLTWDEWSSSPVQIICDREPALMRGEFTILTINGVAYADVGVLSPE